MEDLYKHYLSHPEISTDSRNITQDCIFFALKGESFDGNIFALRALDQGASLAVVDDVSLRGRPGCFWVEDVLSCLQALARMHRASLNFPVIGITGTNGKTTTKELIRSVLQQKYKVFATSGNLNNHIGVPLSILSIPKDTQIAIIEMGANHPGEIDFLSGIASPDYGIITNVGKAHLEGFGSLEGVFRTKTELYRHILGKGTGRIFVNADYTNLFEVAGINPIVYSVLDSSQDFFGEVVSSDPMLIFRVVKKQREELIVRTQLAGAYNLENALAAICIGSFFDVSLDECRKGIEAYIPANKRSQWIQTAYNQVLLDAYNANPTSMRHAILNFAGISATRKLLILGDMLELGPDSHAEHLQILSLLSEYPEMDVLLVGKEFSRAAAGNSYTCYPDSGKLTEYLINRPLKDHHIFIKGSRGIQLEKILPYL